ncbi:MAG: tRNA preQ1(34) S-adenosylmethionine ribosyltransferase-isomerase QueA [Myxococcales bacterium]|nr:tRNA preQ1(34) S-adenosylmethionine ribosyltransferase-isomerase QueA [Myxococcales bacterium]
MDVAEFDYPLPPELIAQAPLPERDASRLLILPRFSGPVEHRMVRDLPEVLQPGDLLVANDARVIPARLRGRKVGTGGKVELLLVEPLGGADWLALGQSSKPLRPGAEVEVGGRFVQIVRGSSDGELVVRLPATGDRLLEFLESTGEIPLPPYIEHAPGPLDRERYQTVFAREPGAVAAPTAGLHFTPALIEALHVRGVQLVQITLHVGPGTFLPVRAHRTEDHRMHSERYFVPESTANALQRAKRVIAIGTTALRTLEASRGRPGPGATDLFITPGYEFKVVQGLFTNFHLPKSTLLMLVSAFSSLPRIKAAYAEAVERRYRFFSYGDAMLIV